MMNSMFNVFDAYCAEILGLYNSTHHLPSTMQVKSINSGSELSIHGKDNKQSPADEAACKKRKKSRVLRLAVELDGLHCFETIVLQWWSYYILTIRKTY